VTGWIGDFFRFWWALFYWNTRKTWFRLRGAHRDDCPCQNYSDSGHALDSRCEAVVQWTKPARFRRVCPLLTETPQGWRCGVSAESVRPFWGRAVLYATGSLLVFYLAGAGVFYGILRAAKYDTSYLALVWPPRWGELRRAQERLYAARAQQAFIAGSYQEAMLSLEMVTQLNPRNYAAGLALASLTQVAGQPEVAEHIYERLMHDVPEQRLPTAQIWFRTLLAGAAYSRIKPLATAMLSEDPAQRGAWLNALLFSARQTRDSVLLGQVLQENPHLPDWCTELIGIEQLLLQGHLDLALPRLTRVYRQPAASYIPYYQIDRLLLHGRPDQAGTLVNAYGNRLQPDEAAFLRVRIYQAKGSSNLVASEYENLLNYPMAPRVAAQFCAYLINHPDPRLLAGYFDKFVSEGPPLNGDTLPLYQSTYLVAALARDTGRADRIAALIMKYTASDARVLHGLVKLLESKAPDPRLSRILPLVQLPTEVVYAILNRTPVAPATP
jgi:hypothetical protein